MLINSILNYNNTLSSNKNFNQYSVAKTPTFAGNTPEKLIKKINETKDLKSLKLSFDEMSKIYTFLGFDVVLKRGSHATIQLTDNVNMPLVIPHKDKCVHPNDIKRLKFVMAGNIKAALSVH